MKYNHQRNLSIEQDHLLLSQAQTNKISQTNRNVQTNRNAQTNRNVPNHNDSRLTQVQETLIKSVVHKQMNQLVQQVMGLKNLMRLVLSRSGCDQETLEALMRNAPRVKKQYEWNQIVSQRWDTQDSFRSQVRRPNNGHQFQNSKTESRTDRREDRKINQSKRTDISQKNKYEEPSYEISRLAQQIDTIMERKEHSARALDASDRIKIVKYISLARGLGYSYVDLCDQVGISLKSWQRWKKEFGSAIEEIDADD